MIPKAAVVFVMLLSYDVLFCRASGRSGFDLNETSYHDFKDYAGLLEDKVPRKSISDADSEWTISLEGSSSNLSLEYLSNSLNLTEQDLDLSYETIWYLDGEERRSITIKRAVEQTTREENLDNKDTQRDAIKINREQPRVKSKRWIFGNDDRKQLLPNSFEAQKIPHSAACKVACKGFCWSCSGILIGSRHVLTSAHCVDGETAGALRVGFLERNGRLHWYNVMKAYIPLRWTTSKPLSSDYAVLKLRRPPTRRTYVKIASLALPKGSVISFTGFPGDKVRNSLWTTKCSVFLVQGGVIYNKCDATRGSSGSGVFVTDSSGTKVVGVLSGETKRSRLNVAVHFTRSKVNQINGWTRK
ncbi:serine protease 23-like [Porites lutea]|uniref:serine protease 23-like n=1 Tax=Porites lutea TaxID=51062 RepID=UPI003CC6A0B5